MKNPIPLPPEIEEHRDRNWRREDILKIETVGEAEQFIEQVGFCACLTDSRQPGPSLYVAVCGRRDAIMPRNVQKDYESSQAWVLKDEILKRGKAYYGKLARGKATFLAERMIPYFASVFGLSKREEKTKLTKEAQAVLKVLRKEWEMGTADLREESGVKDRKLFTRAIDELQAAMIVIPSEVLYQPKFTYIWTLAESRFPDQLQTRVEKKTAFREIARTFLANAGLTVPGELARVSGLSRTDAGLGNWALVDEGEAIRLSVGEYLHHSFHTVSK
ncbi:MAG: hypothetical protein ACKVZH_20030 [Blastocatellia bacterium]